VIEAQQMVEPRQIPATRFAKVDVKKCWMCGQKRKGCLLLKDWHFMGTSGLRRIISLQGGVNFW
jgi:hypothetical protein